MTLKSAVRPFGLIKNSALFLIYFGYCVAAFQLVCPDKTQDSILAIYAKIEKGKYNEYL